MKKQDVLSVIMTFLVGLFVGAFLYVTGFAPIEKTIEVPEETSLTTFTIVGEVYGGCDLAGVCPSFQVLHDGSYRYYHTPAIGAEQVLRQGTLPSELRKRLETAVVPAVLARQAKQIDPSLCNSYTDGIDLKYEITLNGTVYKLDTCGTAVEENSNLWQALSAIWDYFERG